MTAHSSTFDTIQSTAAEKTAAILPFHGRATPDRAEPDAAALALARLQAFLEEEGASLVRACSLLDLTGAEADVAALRALLSDPDATRSALAASAALLERIVEDLAGIPTHAEIQRPLRAGEAAVVRDLDARVRWLGARTEEMLSLLRSGLG